MRGWGLHPRLVAAVVAGIVIVLGGLFFGSSYTSAAHQELITKDAAITAAKQALPNDGAAFSVVDATLEPSSRHFVYSGPGGQSYAEDEVKECMVIPPLPPIPFLTPCRYYPVWVVMLRGSGCEAVIGVNGLTGRFAGAGLSTTGAGSQSGPPADCQVTPPIPNAPLWQPTWG